MRPIVMRLLPISQFWICWNVTPIHATRSDWVNPSRRRCSPRRD